MIIMRRIFAVLMSLVFVAMPILTSGFPRGNASELLVAEQSQYEDQTITLDNGAVVEVYHYISYEIDQEDIQEIVDSHNITSNCRITFYNTGEEYYGTDGMGIAPCDIFQPFPYYTYETELTPVATPHEVRRDFVISVAKGQTVTLTETYQGTLSIEIETGTPFVEGLIGGSISCTYEKSQQFSGPPEDSQYNSRSYYVRYFGQRNSWEQRQYYWGMVLGVASGTVIIPTEYQAYSIDSYVS